MKDEFIQFLIQKNIEVALVQETKLKPNQYINIPNFAAYRTDRTHSRGGGTAVFVKASIKYHARQLKDMPSGLEATTIDITRPGFKEMRIISCYNPPNNTIDPNKFPNLFHRNKPTIAMGDFNCKHQSWNCTTSNTSRRTLYRLTSGGQFFVGAPNEPMHIPYTADRTSEVLDGMCCSNMNYHFQLSVLKELDSDHWPVPLQLHNVSALNWLGNPKKTD